MEETLTPEQEKQAMDIIVLLTNLAPQDKDYAALRPVVEFVLRSVIECGEQLDD